MERITQRLFKILNKHYIRKFSDNKAGNAAENLEKHRANVMARGLPKKKPIPGVQHIVLVASGKGGVGKTTTAVNLACALKAVDPSKEIGLLDADVFGPSVPLMMNINEEPMLNEDNLMEPVINYGVKCMSMGLLVKGEGAVVWRGLMVMQALDRLTRQVAWGPLDCLIVDTPPGTGDTHLSLAQNLPIDGAIVVTTPQMAAIQVTRRGVTMLEKLQIPIYGIIENMAHARCQHCGSQNHIFGVNTEHLSKQMNIPVLESFPLQQSVSEGTACGKPVVLTEPRSEYSKKYRNLANRLYCLLGI